MQKQALSADSMRLAVVALQALCSQLPWYFKEGKCHPD